MILPINSMMVALTINDQGFWLAIDRGKMYLTGRVCYVCVHVFFFFFCLFPLRTKSENRMCKKNVISVDRDTLSRKRQFSR